MKSRGKVVAHGVPYGARARMILLYLIYLSRSERTQLKRIKLPALAPTVR